MTVYESDSSLEFEPHNLECFVGEEVDIVDDNTEPTQMQDHPKDQGKELIEINLTEEGKKAQPI